MSFYRQRQLLSLAETLTRHAARLGVSVRLRADKPDGGEIVVSYQTRYGPLSVPVTVHRSRRSDKILVLCHGAARFPLNRFPRFVTDLVERRNEELEDCRWIDSDIDGRSYLVLGTSVPEEDFISEPFAETFQRMIVETTAVDHFLSENGYGD